MKFLRPSTSMLCYLSAIPYILAGRSRQEYIPSKFTIGRDFYRDFVWQNIPDPTHGRVNYVDQATSVGQNLTYASYDTFILRADDKTVLDASGPGRNSVRLVSRRSYTSHVAVFDVRHMPQGCGTWPAIWETALHGWPTGGEVDIVEGVNDQGTDAVTLHTTEGCSMPASRLQTGVSAQLDCNWLVNYNTGCGVKSQDPLSYGPAFNANGGGWFAMERTEEYISVWFWPRNAKYVPREVRYGGVILRTDRWGLPTAYFPNTSCDFSKHFSEHNIIINLTLCGDWAGNAYSQTSCPSTCVDFVNNNPAAFTGAYFDIASIRVYEPVPDINIVINL